MNGEVMLKIKLLEEAKEEIAQLKRENQLLSNTNASMESELSIELEFKALNSIYEKHKLHTKLLGEAKEEIVPLKREKELLSNTNASMELELKALKYTYDITNNDSFDACRRIQELEREMPKRQEEEERELLNKEHIDLLKNLDEKNNKEVNGEEKTKNKSSDKKSGGGGGGKGQSSTKGKEEDKAKKEPSDKKKGGEGQSSSKMKEKVKEVKGNEIQIIHNLLKLKKVNELQPDMEGFDLIVKVIQVIVTRQKSLQTAEGKIGDNTGVINFKVIGNKNVKHMKVGSYVKLKNARIDLVDNRMRLQPREIEQFDAGGIESIILEENDLSEREFH